MKRAQAKRGKKAGRRAASRAKGKLDIGSIQQEIRNLIFGAAIDMVQSTIQEVKKGHYSAMKFLFELVGMHVEASAMDPEASMTAETLCQRLGIPIGPEPEVTNDSAAAPTLAAMP